MSPTRHRLLFAVAWTAVGLLTAAIPADAQDLHPSRRKSPTGVARTLLADGGITYVSVAYGRPYQRGRENIFGTEESGALVPFGKRWRTGANEATEITLTGDVTAAGEPLLAGTYSLTTIPGPETWTVHFNSTLGLAGTARRNPESGRFEPVELGPTDVLVVTVPVTKLEETVDQFTIDFRPAGGGADMCLRWITTEACVPLRVVEWSVSDELEEKRRGGGPALVDAGAQVERAGSLPATGAPLPSFDDYPATELHVGDPAEVDLDSHPEAREYRTALTRDAGEETDRARFAGHYRIVVIGCGTTCQSVWAVDLVDGSLHNLFTASTGVAFRPESRLIVQNDPAYYEGLLDEMSPSEVERLMDRFGPPRFWVEDEGTFEQIGPQELGVDPRTRRIMASPSARTAPDWRCRNDLEVSCADGSCETETGDGFTPMSVEADEAGALSVCAYSGCWEGKADVFESGEFLILAGHDLEFSTARESERARADVVLAIDRSDGVGTLKVSEFAQPVLCEPKRGAP